MVIILFTEPVNLIAVDLDISCFTLFSVRNMCQKNIMATRAGSYSLGATRHLAKQSEIWNAGIVRIWPRLKYPVFFLCPFFFTPWKLTPWIDVSQVSSHTSSLIDLQRCVQDKKYQGHGRVYHMINANDSTNKKGYYIMGTQCGSD